MQILSVMMDVHKHVDLNHVTKIAVVMDGINHLLMEYVKLNVEMD